jgi:hypothetical protein
MSIDFLLPGGKPLGKNADRQSNANEKPYQSLIFWYTMRRVFLARMPFLLAIYTRFY